MGPPIIIFTSVILSIIINAIIVIIVLTSSGRYKEREDKRVRAYAIPARSTLRITVNFDPHPSVGYLSSTWNTGKV